MKNTRKLLAAVMAVTMVSALAPVSIFATAAEETKITNGTDGKPTPETGSMLATYDVTAKYTVTIPAGVTLDSTNAVSKNIEASDVMLESGKKIKVTLTEASNTASGSSFSAKNDKGDSTARYTISKGETAVAVGDVVAEFTEDGEQSLTFSKAEGATYAGAHTEVLTFGVSVENAAAANPYLAAELNSVVQFAGYDWYVIAKETDGVTLLMKDNLMNKAYNDSFTDVTWETCSLRSYLNVEFYNSLTDPYKANIIKTHNSNPNNGSTSGGNATDDYIYLLSIDEANALDSSIRNDGSRWWLRSPGYDSRYAAVVYEDGYVGTSGNDVAYEGGVRPALNLKF